MQPMRLCILSGMLFEDTFEKHTVEKSQTNVRRANVLQPSQAGILWGHLKLHGEGKQVQINPSRRYIDRHQCVFHQMHPQIAYLRE